jgi:hypothetical protein
MPSEPHVNRARRGERETRRIGREVWALASAQYGVLTRWQLRRIGASDDQIDRWLGAGRLVPLHRGVLVVGHRLLSIEGRWMAGVLAGGVEAALCGAAATDHWELSGLARPKAHVAVASHHRSRPGLEFHQRRLPADERTIHEGIPITTVARTLFDAAATESPARLRQMIAIAESRGLADSPSLPELLERYPGARGTARLRTTLTDTFNEGLADRELELRFAEFLDECGFPRPQKNAPVLVGGGRTLIVDCLWREAGLVVELDSRRHHADWEAAETDRARDAALLAVGLRTLRVTWRRLHHERRELENELRSAIELHVDRASRGERESR